MGEEVEREGREGVRRALPALCCEGGEEGEDGRGWERKTHPGPPCREGERIRSRKEREGAGRSNRKRKAEDGKRKTET